MDRDRYERLSKLFEEARRLNEEARGSFLDEACGDDQALKTELESLLGYEQEGARLLGATVTGSTVLATHHEADPADRSPTPRIGRYRIVRRLGVGGMGEVYEAEQEEPIRRRVALKVIKWGMDSKHVVARFNSERQALALMDHPSIARVFDAGATPHGRPFFVMELVDGEPISDYCDHRRLIVTERLELFRQVCDAVQHAHHKGVIHRDLKPSNVLVTEQDGAPVPKIIDFGVAKAVEQRLTEMTLFTGRGQLVGTPAYMSPEQAEMSAADIDTRTDVYSLGVLLYELLVGVLPFRAEHLQRVDFDEMRRVIREDNPPRPSERVSTLGTERAETGRRRRVEGRELVRLLDGDLDWITMRALEKDRARRYGSPAELAADIGRYLSHEPVLASPPSTVYRMRKFVRRHRLGTAAAASIVVALVLGTVLATVGLVRAQRSALEARRSERAATEVADLMVGVFEVADPNESRGNTVTARELLDRASARIERSLETEPLTQARLQHTMGRVYHNLGLYEPAESLLRQALQTREQQLGQNDPVVVDSWLMLGQLRISVGDLEGAEAYHREALKLAEAAHGDDHLQTAWGRYYLGLTLTRSGEEEESERLLRDAMRVFERELGPDDVAVAWCLNDLSNLKRHAGDPQGAFPLLERSLEIKQKALGPDHADVAKALANLGSLFSYVGEHERALDYHRQSLAIMEKTFEADHPDVGFGLSAFALVAARAGAFDEAERAYRRFSEILAATWGPEHPMLLYQQSCYLALVERPTESVDHLRRAMAAGVGGPMVINDPDLASLHGDPGFEELVAPIRQQLGS